MVSRNAISASDDDGNVVSRLTSDTKKQGKVPRRIHKAEREKQKRDHMNVLFLELSKAIEPANMSNGKASVLKDTIRLLKELLTQLDCLKKENTTLLSESHYVNVEKDELYEENSVLKGQIQKLRSDIEERYHSQASINLNSAQSEINPVAFQPPEDHFKLPSSDNASQAPSVVGPVFILPVQHESQLVPQSDIAASNVSKPQPRYPSASDSWPSHILDK